MMIEKTKQMYNRLPDCRLCYATLSFCLLVQFATAQVLRRDTVPPRKQVEIIRFSDDEEENSSRNKTRKDPSGLLKLAPLSFIVGYFPVFYEREINDLLSIQVGTGLTFKPAVSNLQNELYLELSEDGDCPYGDCDDHLDYTYRQSKIGWMFSLSPRLYFNNEGAEGSYIAPELRLYSRRSEAQKPDPNAIELTRLSDEFDQEQIRYTDIMVHGGWQVLYPKLALDWSVGVGVRNITGSWQRIYTNPTYGYYFSETPKQNLSRFRFDIGLRIGFQL